MLIENPVRRYRGPSYVAPYSYMSGGKRRYVSGHIRKNTLRKNSGGKSMKNPLAVKGITKEWFGGLTFMDMGAALAGLAVTTALPSYLVKDTTTTTNKILKVAAAFGSAALSGFVFRNISPSAGKYAVAGGVASALSQTLSVAVGINLGRPGMTALPAPHGYIRPARNISESRFEPGPGAEPGVQVSVT